MSSDHASPDQVSSVTTADRAPSTLRLEPKRESRREATRHGLPPLDLTPDAEKSPALLVFLGQVDAFRHRTHRRHSWVCDEVMLLLDAASKAAVTSAESTTPVDLDAAQRAFVDAQQIYFRDTQSKNRLIYVGGLVIGVVLAVLLPIAVVAGVELFRVAALDEHLHPMSTVAPLFGFAGAGAAASVLSRLTTIDLKDETSKLMVLVSGATRPALAVLFASVVFVILQHDLLKVGVVADGKAALIWVASFLCGYSERFASDMLERMPFGAGPSGTRGDGSAAPSAVPR